MHQHSCACSCENSASTSRDYFSRACGHASTGGAHRGGAYSTGAKMQFDASSGSGPRIVMQAPHVDLGEVRVQMTAPTVRFGQPKLHLGAPQLTFNDVHMSLGEPEIELGTPTITMGRPEVRMAGGGGVRYNVNPSFTMAAPVVTMGEAQIDIGASVSTSVRRRVDASAGEAKVDLGGCGCGGSCGAGRAPGCACGSRCGGGGEGGGCSGGGEYGAVSTSRSSNKVGRAAGILGAAQLDSSTGGHTSSRRYFSRYADAACGQVRDSARFDSRGDRRDVTAAACMLQEEDAERWGWSGEATQSHGCCSVGGGVHVRAQAQGPQHGYSHTQVQVQGWDDARVQACTSRSTPQPPPAPVHTCGAGSGTGAGAGTATRARTVVSHRKLLEMKTRHAYTLK